ncbi:MAG: hypothetical protein AB1715_08455, partial [Acidobacteriota bacterium]
QSSSRDPFSREMRKKRLLAWMLRDVTKEKIYELISRDIPECIFAEFVDRIYHRETDPYTVAEELIARLKDKR